MSEQKTVAVVASGEDEGRSDFLQRFPLLSYLIATLFFIVFPLLLLDQTLDGFFLLKQEKRATAIESVIGQRFDDLARAADGRAFFHNYLSQKFLAVEKQSLGSAQSGREFSHRLKTLHPGSFSFIFWDQDGKLLKSISDQTRFITILERLHSLMSEILNSPLEIFFARKKERKLDESLKRMRMIVGPFVTLAELAKPFLNPSKAACAECEGFGSKAFLWFKKGRNLSVLVFIDSKLVKSDFGLKETFRKWHGKTDLFTLHLYDREKNTVTPELAQTTGNDLRLNLDKFSRLFPESQLFSNDYHFRFRKTNKYFLCAVIPQSSFGSFIDKKRTMIAQTFCGIIILLYVLSCFSLTHGFFFSSVKFRLAAAFIFSSLLPLLLSVSFGFDFVNKSRVEKERLQTMKNLNLLQSVDGNFAFFLENKARKIEKFLFANLPSVIDKKSNKELKQKFFELKEIAGFSSVIVVDSRGKDLLENSFGGTLKNYKLIRDVIMEVIEFRSYSKENLKPLSFSPLTRMFIDSIQRREGKIFRFNMGSESFYQQAFFLRREKTGEELVVLLFWEPFGLQHEFLREVSFYLREKSIYIYFPEFMQFFNNENPTIDMEKIEKGLNESGFHCLNFPDRQVLAFRGQEADKLVYLADSRFSVQNFLPGAGKMSLVAMAVFACFLTGIYLVARQQTIQPISLLEKGVKNIHAQSFSNQVSIDGDNEFSALAEAMNLTMINLKELGIAKVVQENLMLNELVETEKFQIFARSIPMTHIGGDYHDFFASLGGCPAVLMADVSGHGVPAALLMAMAKATIVMNQNSEKGVGDIISQLNQVFIRLKQTAIHKFMTCQILQIDEKNDKLTLFNAGHCFPVLFNAETQNAGFVAIKKSLPLGYPMKVPCCSPVDLNENETLILYSDGIPEARNAKKEVLGEERFLRLIERSYADNIEQMWHNIWQNYTQWSAEQEDDITVVLLRRRLERQ